MHAEEGDDPVVVNDHQGERVGVELELFKTDSPWVNRYAQPP